MEYIQNNTEADFARQFSDYYEQASPSERAIMVAIGHIRRAVVLGRENDRSLSRDRSKESSTTTETERLFPHYAQLLRSTAAWQNLGSAEKERMEQDLLSLPD